MQIIYPGRSIFPAVPDKEKTLQQTLEGFPNHAAELQPLQSIFVAVVPEP